LKHFKLSNPIKPEELEDAYTNGMIRKSDLKDGKYYLGHCRNSSIAVWHKDKNCFTYQRSKFGHTFPEDINHPEDDNGFDLFTPYEELP
jgi:hypothetical protein